MHEHDDEGVDWFKWLDILVWAAVFVIAGLCLEWLFGTLARESVASGAERFLRRQEQAAAEAGSE